LSLILILLQIRIGHLDTISTVAVDTVNGALVDLHDFLPGAAFMLAVDVTLPSDPAKQILHPLDRHRHRVWLAHVLYAREESGFLHTPMLHHQHAILDGEKLVQHSIDEEQTARWLVNDAVLQEGEARLGVDFHLLNVTVAKLDGEDLG